MHLCERVHVAADLIDISNCLISFSLYRTQFVMSNVISLFAGKIFDHVGSNWFLIEVRKELQRHHTGEGIPAATGTTEVVQHKNQWCPSKALSWVSLATPTHQGKGNQVLCSTGSPPALLPPPNPLSHLMLLAAFSSAAPASSAALASTDLKSANPVYIFKVREEPPSTLFVLQWKEDQVTSGLKGKCSLSHCISAL